MSCRRAEVGVGGAIMFHVSTQSEEEGSKVMRRNIPDTLTLPSHKSMLEDPHFTEELTRMSLTFILMKGMILIMSFSFN